MSERTSRRGTWTMGAIGAVVGVVLTAALVPLIDAEPQRVDAGATAADAPASFREFAAGEEAPTGTADGTDAGGAGATGDATSPAGGASGGPTSPTTAAPGAGGGSTAGAAPLRATDQGVTASTIKLGFLLLDLGSTGRIGVNTTGVNPDQQRAAFEAFLKDLNDRGGINGRRVEGFYRVFDVTNPDDQRAACLAATEDAKAFAVIAMPGFANAAVLCVTKEHATPLILTGQGVSRSFFTESQGRLVTLQMAGDRMMRNLAAELDAKGVLDGRKIGIVSSEEAQYIETIDRGLVPVLREAGHEVVHVSRLATFPRAQGQIAPEVQRMRAAGADTVLMVGSFLNAVPFVQTAEQQQWRPRYLVSEFGGLSSDFEVQAMPQSFDGALAMTSQRFAEWRSNIPEPASDARCRELYERATGERIPRNDGDTSNAAYPVVLYSCGMVKVFAAAATAAGPELTRSAFGAALQRLGPSESGFYFPGAFRPGKADLADSLRFNRFDHSCRCWRVADDVRPARFR
jgi:ABC-type branched-subunit amino acid transport system substrate-binding protein